MLWNGTRKNGIESMAICPTKGPMVDVCRKMDIPVEVMPYHQPSWRHPIAMYQEFRKWRQLLDRMQPDVIHANDFFNARSVSASAKSLGLPVVCHIHFHAQPDYLSWVFRFLPKPDVFIHNSEATRQLCEPILKKTCPHAKQTLVHNAVSLDRFLPSMHNGDKHYPPRVGIIANLIPIKGHMDFLKMARLLTNRGVEAEYWIIGEDIHESGFRRILENRKMELALGQRVKFMGARSDVPDLLRQMDVVVCASHMEPFGIVIAEAMACELPVVGTRVGGIPEVIENGVTGFLVSPHAPAELADKVELLLTDFSLCLRMGKTGRQRVHQYFSQEPHVEKITKLYYELARVKI